MKGLSKSELSGARILVTNDDGIFAPGLKVLERIAKSLSSDVWVVAPETEQSATSHSLTLRRPLRLRKQGRRRFSVDGTPTDCVVVAHNKVLADRPADLVLSGVNHGANLGEDVIYSGTVAAAMEAAVLGLRGIAFSQVRTIGSKAHWATTEAHAAAVVRKLVTFDWPRDLLFNVNFPPVAADRVTGVRVCSQGRRDVGTNIVEDTDPGGRPYLWLGDFLSDSTVTPKSDLAAIQAGAVSITPLHFDMTHKNSMKALREIFAG